MRDQLHECAIRLAARSIDAIRINRTAEIEHNGVAGWLKCRRFGRSALIWPGNLFLRLSRSGIRMFTSVQEWQAHEIRSFQLCHPEREAHAVGRTGIFTERLPGRSLRELAAESRLTTEMMESTAKEFMRVHSLTDPVTGEAWSHGDPHLANFLFDPVSRRCYLVDFETIHEHWRAAAWRHADDVLVLCLELLALDESAEPVSRAADFIHAYAMPEVVRELRQRLYAVPNGLERVLWATRTGYLGNRMLRARLKALLASL